MEEKTFIFEEGNSIPYGQDMGFYRGIPSGIEFRVEEDEMFSMFNDKDTVKLVAKRYGDKNEYGNGAIYVKKLYLENEEDEMECPECNHEMERIEQHRCPSCGSRFERHDRIADLNSGEDSSFLAFVVDRAIQHQRQLINDLTNSSMFIKKEQVIKEESNYLKKLKAIKDKLPLPVPPECEE